MIFFPGGLIVVYLRHTLPPLRYLGPRELRHGSELAFAWRSNGTHWIGTFLLKYKHEGLTDSLLLLVCFHARELRHGSELPSRGGATGHIDWNILVEI